MKRFKIGLAISMAFLLVVLAGCQAVGGLDINKALVESLTVKSSESKQTLSLEIVPTSSDLSKEDKKMIDLLNSFSISIDHAITQDSSTGSVEGAISLDGIKLPFHLSMDKKTMLIWVEGAKQPLSISLDAIEGADMSELQLSNEKSLALMKDVGKFFFNNVANPAKISVAPVSEKVNGEAVNLQKLHMEIHGDELVGLVKSFLTSVSKDKEGVKELIGTLYDVYYPIIKTLIPLYADDYEGYYSEYKESATFGTLESIIQDKEATVIYLTNQLQKSLDKLLVDYDKEVQDLFTESPELNKLFGKDTVLSMDVMVDSKLNIRKQNMDLTVQIPDVEDMPIKQFKIHSTSEIWNVNEPVTVKKVDTSKGVMELDLNDMMGMTPGKILRNFDQKSEVYRFLKEDMSISQKYITLDTINYADDYDDGGYYDYAMAYNIKNTTMVPLRYVAERLDAQLEWDGASKTTTIT
ncbi:MAG TPA: stalk domain-containing protein, partial [Paenibacillus sp.]